MQEALNVSVSPRLPSVADNCSGVIATPAVPLCAPGFTSTWPNTREALETTFFDIPVEETRRILGLATADAFGFDVEALRPLAEKIGPTPTDLGQLSDTQTAADLTARWAKVREVGRHWLTGHDFPLYGEPPEG